MLLALLACTGTPLAPRASYADDVRAELARSLLHAGAIVTALKVGIDRTRPTGGH